MDFQKEYIEDSCGALTYEEYLEGRLRSVLSDLNEIRKYLMESFTCPSCRYEGSIASVVIEKIAHEKEVNDWFKQFE